MISFRSICGRALAIPVILLAGGAQAHSHKFKNLEIVHPWCVETRDTATPVAVYMTIRNRAGRPDKLLRATTSIATRTELLAGAIEVSGGGEVDLKRDGPHIRLSGMKRQLGAYDSFPMTLLFERAGKVKVEVMVEEAAVLEPANKEGY
jgi:copper(I)-binding protein